ncbi:MAG TPA: LuxR C-terminal-related transcriptional regulator, partial [Myxococcota bacterium]|nr:LuxR C-terminal-related transcriptional regulator [Myxococcota bacterium]
SSLERMLEGAGLRSLTFCSAEAFEPTSHAGPCCLVLDVKLPTAGGIEVLRALARRTELPIIFVTDRCDVPLTVQAMKAGAVEVLTKPFEDATMLRAIADAMERSTLMLRLDGDLRALRDKYEALTRREREVMALVVAGMLNKQVGAELGISEITVKAHRGQVMRKMKAASLPDLVNMAARLGAHKTAS